MSKKERTTIMSPGEEPVFPQASISQMGVGKLEIKTMAYSSYENKEICFSHEITLQDDSKGLGGWGEVIFEGTLKELICLVKEAKSGRKLGIMSKV